MCFLLFAVNHHPDFPLIVAANRDEYLSRPTTAAAWWETHPDVMGGRDLEAGGTWLGMHRDGRFAALTNYRDPNGHDTSRPSRGALVSDFLTSRPRTPAANYINDIDTSDVAYNGYNLVAGSGSALIHYSNQTEDMTLMTPGVHALSNALLDTPWPKAERGRRTLEQILVTGGEPDREAMLALLSDRDIASDDVLPETGVGQEAERALSPIFIRHGAYGTRCTTILTLREDGEVTFMERTWKTDPTTHNDVTHNDVVWRFSLID